MERERGEFLPAIEEKPPEEEAKDKKEGLEIDAEGTIRTTERYPLNGTLQNIVRGYFETRGFSIVEISDTHVKVVAPDGKRMAIPNKTAVETATAR
ncbi:MAG: hypothetical protein HYU81_01340 [Candidatus Brennerbacteria bacterium]|nr:hypothetical protein [Candidatus Brennerbacteria bacterium]